ncbi:MAG: amidohydrolase [Cloacibacillus sp.]
MTQATYKNVAVWDAQRGAAKLCDVRVKDGLFSAVAAAGSFTDDAGFNGHGKCAMLPGFVNAHGHAAMTMLRGMGEGLPLMDWLQKKIWPAEERLTADIVRAGTRIAMMEMLASGTTCYADMYFFMSDEADEALAAGMRAGLSRGIVGDKDGSRLRENLQLAKDYNGKDGLISVQLGPHAPYTVPFELMEKVAAAAVENDLAVQLHWLETKNDWPMSNSHMTPEEYLKKSGLLAVKHLLLAHCVWLDEECLPFYARPNVTLVNNPKSNLKLGSGIAKVDAMVKAGVNVAIGTDGASSNNGLDMWEETRFANLLQKGAGFDATALSAEKSLEMATINGARALGFENTGLIKEGWNADFMLIDLDSPNYVGWDEENLAGCIVYAGSSRDIMRTVVAGQVLYDSGIFTTIDAEKTLADAAAGRKILTA